MKYRIKRGKYGNKKTTIDGITFDSKKEAEHYQALKILKKLGEVKSFQMQVKYQLLPAFPKVQRAMIYIADFVVFLPDGTIEVQDVKGRKTEVYKIKKKLMYYFHKIKIKEI